MLELGGDFACLPLFWISCSVWTKSCVAKLGLAAWAGSCARVQYTAFPRWGRAPKAEMLQRNLEAGWLPLGLFKNLKVVSCRPPHRVVGRARPGSTE